MTFAKTCTTRSRSSAEGQQSNTSPADRRACFTPPTSIRSRLIPWPIRSLLALPFELPKTRTSARVFSPPEEVEATSEYRLQSLRMTESLSLSLGTSPRASATPSAAPSLEYDMDVGRSSVTTSAPRARAASRLWRERLGPLTRTL